MELRNACSLLPVLSRRRASGRTIDRSSANHYAELPPVLPIKFSNPIQQLRLVMVVAAQGRL